MEETLSSSKPTQTAVFHRTCLAMNTRFSMVVVGMEAERAEELGVEAERDLRAFERLMSRFDAEGPVSDLNHRAAVGAVRPPDELWQILVLCRDYWQRTRGAFDIAMWPLHRLWREHLERGAEPAADAMRTAREQSGFQGLRFDEAVRTVAFEREGMSIDLGGFGKGYALERLAGGLRAQGVERAFLSFGESSITVLGAHPHGSSWPVGIANIFDPSNTVHRFELRDASLSSSGTGPSNRMGGEPSSGEVRAFGQTIDPHSGRPIEGYRTVSVACGSAIDAEVLSTALLVTPVQERAALLSEFPSLEGVEIVYDSNAREFTPRIDWKHEL